MCLCKVVSKSLLTIWVAVGSTQWAMVTVVDINNVVVDFLGTLFSFVIEDEDRR